MAAAITSLKSKNLVPERRKIIGDVCENVLEFLDKNKFQYWPSRSNCFMVDVKRHGNDVVLALRKEKIYIGRVWPSWPTYVRVTVGTRLFEPLCGPDLLLKKDHTQNDSQGGEI